MLRNAPGPRQNRVFLHCLQFLCKSVFTRVVDDTHFSTPPLIWHGVAVERPHATALSWAFHARHMDCHENP